MRNFTCEIGDVFGYWEVIDNTPIIKSGHTFVKVRCKCGKEDYKCLSDLKRGKVTGCRNCKARERSRKINIGDKYKHWVVIGGPRTTEHQCLVWLCQCDCGGEKRWIQGNELTNLNMSFECLKCAGKRRGDAQAKRNGKVGELTLTRFTRLKRSAEKRKIDFNVSIEFLWDLFQSQKQICAITGDYISNIKDASLDRIDSSKGYIEGNVQWVTYQANVSKHVMTMEQLYEFCKKVLNHANQQPNTLLTKCDGSETIS